MTEPVVSESMCWSKCSYWCDSTVHGPHCSCGTGVVEWTAHQSHSALLSFFPSGGNRWQQTAPSISCIMRQGPRWGEWVSLLIQDTDPGQLHFRQRMSAWILHRASCMFVSHLTWNASDPTAIMPAVFRLVSISVLTGKGGFFHSRFSVRYLLLAVH